MTKAEDDLRMNDKRSTQPYQERHVRYAHNALVEADLAEHRGRAERRAVRLIENAADNARRNGDTVGEALYRDMAAIAADIAVAQDEKAEAARAIAAHYGTA